MAQTAFYKTFGGTAPENYEKYFVPYIGRPLASDLMDAASLQPGERVLDVACGTGVVTRLANDQVGPTGAVAGLDLNPGMLAVARSVVPADSRITWYESSAESMPVDDGAFDVVLCQLGLQFMNDKPAALGEMYRVLAPGGRLLVSVAGPTPPPFVNFAVALGRHINPQISLFVHMVCSLNETEELEALVRGAGFSETSVNEYERHLRLPPPRDFLWQYVHSTPLADAVAQADDETRAALEHEVVTAWQAFVEDGAMTVSPRLLLAIGRK
jgi:ubiquinone/menaquinone biosynthesis C-methylase UbiE